MILDTLNNLQLYAGCNPLFPEVIRFIAENDLSTLAPGRHEILGGDLFVNIDEAKPRTREEARLESHIRMIDIQIPITAPEEMGYTPVSNLPEAPYNDAKDITFYPGEAQSYFQVTPQQFVIFFPHDGHAPAISPTPWRKAIFKIKA